MKKIIILGVMLLTIMGIGHAQAPAASTILKAYQKAMSSYNVQPIADMLDAAGYVYRFTEEGSDYNSSETYVMSKNCRVIHEQYGNGIEYSPSPENAKSSICVLTVSGTSIQLQFHVYARAGFTTWSKQLKALGYRESYGGKGNRGQDWTYTAPGKPEISIWNDLGNTYVFSIGSRW